MVEVFIQKKVGSKLANQEKFGSKLANHFLYKYFNHSQT
jgi:hypothetical protein